MSSILIIDEYPLFRRALHTALSSVHFNLEINEAGSLAAAQDALSRKTYALAVLDLGLSGQGGNSGVLEIRRAHPRLPILVMSENETPAAASKAIALGASGYVPLSAPAREIASAVRAVLAGEIALPAFLPQPVAPSPQLVPGE